MKATLVWPVWEGKALKINGFPFQSFHLAQQFSEEEFGKKAKYLQTGPAETEFTLPSRSRSDLWTSSTRPSAQVTRLPNSTKLPQQISRQIIVHKGNEKNLHTGTHSSHGTFWEPQARAFLRAKKPKNCWQLLIQKQQPLKRNKRPNWANCWR